MQYFSLLRLCSVLPTETAVPLISAENELADFAPNSATSTSDKTLSPTLASRAHWGRSRAAPPNSVVTAPSCLAGLPNGPRRLTGHDLRATTSS